MDYSYKTMFTIRCITLTTFSFTQVLLNSWVVTNYWVVKACMKSGYMLKCRGKIVFGFLRHDQQPEIDENPCFKRLERNSCFQS